jgi:ornithine decarboxylase
MKSSADSTMQKFPTAREAALALRPDEPVYGFRPQVLAADAREFMALFPGKTAYAVKTNGEPMILEVLAKAGIQTFDVASPAEFEAARAAAPDCELLYMHPVKAQSHIRLALETYGIRDLSLDHEDEVAKILRIVRALDIPPEEITLFLRLATKGAAAYELSKKFGATPTHAVELLDRMAGIGFKTGIAFHVGSQVEDPETYERGLASVAWVRSRIKEDIVELDIGGGFPAQYGIDPKKKGANSTTPTTQALMHQITSDIADWKLDDLPLVAEPGRVIVARCLSVIVRVMLKKGQRLYINDGVWASLSDSWTGKLLLPTRFIPDPARKRRNGSPDKLLPFRVCGATCDSVDILTRPFYLPETVDTGDWIEIGHIGAYSLGLRTRFNGFYPDKFVEIEAPFDEEPGVSIPIAAE